MSFKIKKARNRITSIRMITIKKPIAPKVNEDMEQLESLLVHYW